jgi:hypothetical protein
MMDKVVLAVLVAAGLTSAQAGELWVGLDMSDSAPLLLEDAQAAAAGKTIAAAIRGLERGDLVRIISFGESGVWDRQIDLTIELSSRNRPEVIAPQVQALIASLPQRAREGQLHMETQTNAMGFLERIGPLLNCQAEPTTVLVMTDGIEWSAAITGKDLIAGAPLPPPSGPILQGCAVTFWGMGQQRREYGHDDGWYPILRAAWSTYMDQAGVAAFAAYGEYKR